MLPSHGRSRGFESLIAHHPHPLILIRHGQTEWNAARRFQGSLDSPLTAEGRTQAAEIGQAVLRHVAGAGWTDWSVVVSSQGRARASARLAFPDIATRVDPDLAEIGMGAWEGLTADEIDAGWPGPQLEPVLAFYARAPSGETLADLAARARRALGRLEGPAVLVTHGITLRVLAALALGRDIAAAEELAGPQGTFTLIERGWRNVVAARTA